MRRYSVNPRVDRAVFRDTSARVKSINLGTHFMRGGIRL